MSTTIRKSAFGRTQLFHNDANITFQELQCASSIVRKNEHDCKFHTISNEKKCNCWHCCHPFDSEVIKLPRLYDIQEEVYHVYGTFCSLSCAKAYISQLPFFQKEQHLYVFNRMANEFYNSSEVVEAPPRETLQMFGGPFTIEEFRSKTHRCVVQHPPFVSYCMIVEEKMAGHNNIVNTTERTSVRGMRIPEKGIARQNTVEVSDNRLTNRYAQYCERQSTEEPIPKKAKTEKKTTETGGLGRFMKKT